MPPRIGRPKRRRRRGRGEGGRREEGARTSYNNRRKSHRSRSLARPSRSSPIPLSSEEGRDRPNYRTQLRRRREREGGRAIFYPRQARWSISGRLSHLNVLLRKNELMLSYHNSRRRSDRSRPHFYSFSILSREGRRARGCENLGSTAEPISLGKSPFQFVVVAVAAVLWLFFINRLVCLATPNGARVETRRPSLPIYVTNVVFSAVAIKGDMIPAPGSELESDFWSPILHPSFLHRLISFGVESGDHP